MNEKGYVHPEVLVSTAWVAEHLNDPAVRVVESNEDIMLYDIKHIPGAVQIDWQRDLNDPLTRDYLGRLRRADSNWSARILLSARVAVFSVPDDVLEGMTLTSSTITFVYLFSVFGSALRTSASPLRRPSSFVIPR